MVAGKVLTLSKQRNFYNYTNKEVIRLYVKWTFSVPSFLEMFFPTKCKYYKSKGVQTMTNHVNKGKQKSSVRQSGNAFDSDRAKSEKMERHHQLRQQREND